MSAARILVLIAGLIGYLTPVSLLAVDWEIEVRGPEASGGHLRMLLYDDPIVYASRGKPLSVRSVRWPGSQALLRFEDLDPGDYAIRVFLDRDDDGEFDPPRRGRPGELVGYSQNPLVRGPRPPDWDRLRIRIGDERRRDSIVLGVRPSPWSVGIGTVYSTQPYDGLDDRLIPIPAISYRGERLRVEGPFVDYAVVISPPVRLSLVAGYRLDGYDADDSDALAGMDDREDTAELGVRARFRAPGGLRLELRATHDLLGRHQGGQVTGVVARSFAYGRVRLEPFLHADWLSREFADYYFGVDDTEVAVGRPRTNIGSVIHPRVGLNFSWFIGERWFALVRSSVEFLAEEVRDSPIIDEDVRVRLIVAFSYTF